MGCDIPPGTQHLQTDELDVYLMIPMAMWSRASSEIPDDDKRVAGLHRVLTTTWRVAPALQFAPIGNSADGMFTMKGDQQ